MTFLQRLFGPPDIGKLKAKGHIRGLVKALSYGDDESLQRAAVEALEEMSLSREYKALVGVHKLLHQKAQVASEIDKTSEKIRRHEALLAHWSNASDYDSSQMGVGWAKMGLEEDEAKQKGLLAEAKQLDHLLEQAKVELEAAMAESKDKHFVIEAQKVLGRL